MLSSLRLLNSPLRLSSQPLNLGFSLLLLSLLLMLLNLTPLFILLRFSLPRGSTASTRPGRRPGPAASGFKEACSSANISRLPSAKSSGSHSSERIYRSQTQPGAVNCTVLIAANDGVCSPIRSIAKTAATMNATIIRLAISCLPAIEFVPF
jgi:hypothetical protein